jgi:hypothetical protein
MSPVSLGPPCVPLKPQSDWWISSSVKDARESIANPDVWAVLCTGRSLQSGARYRVPELLQDAGLHFDEVILNPGSETAIFKATAVLKILRKHPEIDTVQVWEDQTKNIVGISSVARHLGVKFIPHKIRVLGHDLLCGEEDIEALEAEGWSRMGNKRAVQGPSLWAVDLELGLTNARRAAEKLSRTPAVTRQTRQLLSLLDQGDKLQKEIAEGIQPSFWQSMFTASGSLRYASLRLASSYPVGHPVRRALLEALSRKLSSAIYTEIILDDMLDLIYWWRNSVGPTLSKTFSDHLTLQFKPSPDEVTGLPLGKKVHLQVIGYAADDHAQVVVVRSPIPSDNRVPHITVATDGTPPRYSNDLLEKGWIKVNGPSISGTIGFFDGKDHRWDLKGTIYEVEAA